MSEEQSRRIIQAIQECDSFLEKEEKRNPALRPADVAQHLEFCKQHKIKLIAMLDA
jgi:predicted nucleic acid-binding protein